MRFHRGLEQSRGHLRLARLGPARPASVQCPESGGPHIELLSKPHLCRHRLLQPLLEIACVQSPYRFPAAFCLLALCPICLPRPVRCRNKYRGSLCLLSCGDRGPVPIVLLGLSLRVPFSAKFPSGFAIGDPRRGGASFDRAVPTPSLGVIVSREINEPQLMPGRVNQLAQEHREQLPGINTTLSPTLDLTSLDGQKRRDIGSSCDALFYPMPAISVELCLDFQ